MTPPLSAEIRLATTADRPFILDSWTKAARHQYPNQYALDFAQHHRRHIEALLLRSVAIVAHLAGEPAELLSYLVYESFKGSLVAHYSYTKADARQQGLCRSLLTYANPLRRPVVATHAAKNEALMIHLTKTITFDPSLLALLESAQ